MLSNFSQLVNNKKNGILIASELYDLERKWAVKKPSERKRMVPVPRRL